MKKSLFISYDGMTDPLGQSQILPYIIGLAEKGYKFSLISCEKTDRLKKYGAIISEITQKHDIDWHPLPFTTFPPIISKLLDKRRIIRKAFELHKKEGFDIIHCRSYLAIEAGLKLKKAFGPKVLFDMRGFWVDERVDGGIWNLKNPFFSFAYKYYKKEEARYIKESDWIISLTKAAVSEIESWPSYSGTPFSVIPCSADFNHFQVPDQEQKLASRKELGISEDSFVLSYLGSIGTWYLLDEMLLFFSELKKQDNNAVFLFITPEPAEKIIKAASKCGISPKHIKVVFATRKEVPARLAASDVSISFIKPAYSKIASSPTKLGELFAMGIPVISNTKVGDVAEIIKMVDAGVVTDEFSEESFQKAAQLVLALKEKSPEEIRQKAFDYYNLDNAIGAYFKAYQKLLA